MDNIKDFIIANLDNEIKSMSGDIRGLKKLRKRTEQMRSEVSNKSLTEITNYLNENSPEVIAEFDAWKKERDAEFESAVKKMVDEGKLKSGEYNPITKEFTEVSNA